MFIYNVTVKVEPQIAEAWLAWLRNEHIPQVMATGCFIDHQVLQLQEVDDSDGPTYAIQYKAATRADYDNYQENFAKELQAATYQQWGERCIGFRSLLKILPA